MQLHVVFKISILLYNNNQEAIVLASNLEYYRRTKHIDVQYYWIQKTIELGLFVVLHERSHADELRNSLSKPNYSLGVLSCVA